RKRWQKKGHNGVFVSLAKKRFYQTFSREFIKQGWLACDFLELDGQPAACQMCFRYNGTLFLLQEGFDPAYENESVGIALRAMVFRNAIQTGIRQYDFLAGSGRHKTQWDVRMTNCENCSVGQRTVRGCHYVQSAAHLEDAK